MLFAVRLGDLTAIKALDLTRASNVEIIGRLRQVFDFLPKETKIEVADGIVTIDIPDSAAKDKSEADRLHIRAIQRAKQGDYRKAVGIDDPGVVSKPVTNQAVATDDQPQGTTNPELLRSKDMASTMYLLAALERFEKLPAAKVKQIALEIGVLGMSSLDYASSEKKYRLNALSAREKPGVRVHGRLAGRRKNRGIDRAAQGNGRINRNPD